MNEHQQMKKKSKCHISHHGNNYLSHILPFSGCLENSNLPTTLTPQFLRLLPLLTLSDYTILGSCLHLHDFISLSLVDWFWVNTDLNWTNH